MSFLIIDLNTHWFNGHDVTQINSSQVCLSFELYCAVLVPNHKVVDTLKLLDGHVLYIFEAGLCKIVILRTFWEIDQWCRFLSLINGRIICLVDNIDFRILIDSCIFQGFLLVQDCILVQKEDI